MSTKRHAGHFRVGYDPRRHIFTRDECVRGFLAAEASIERRYPGCDPHFLMCALIGSVAGWASKLALREAARLESMGEEPTLAAIERMFLAAAIEQ